jgi:hypothetical protein
MPTKYGGKTIAEMSFADTQVPQRLAIERLIVPDGNGEHQNSHEFCCTKIRISI